MYRFLHRIYEHDPSGMLIISIPLFFIGLRLVHRYPRMHAACSLLSLFTGAALVVEHYVFQPLERDMAFPRLACTALMTSWFVIGPFWIVGFFLGVISENVLVPIYRRWKKMRDSWKRMLSERARLAAVKRAEWERRLEEERLRPERERQRLLAEEAKEAEARRRERLQRVLIKFRSACEFFYTQHIPEITKRLPRKEFKRLLERYLGESVPIDLVEENGAKILELLKGHVSRLGSEEAFEGLSGMLRWFRREKERIEALDLPPDEEEVIMATLESRMAELQDSIIRKMAPGGSR